MIRVEVGYILHEDICEHGRRCADSRTHHVPQWSRFGVPYHALHFVKPNIGCLQLDMSRVCIKMKLFVEWGCAEEGRGTEDRQDLRMVIAKV